MSVATTEIRNVITVTEDPDVITIVADGFTQTGGGGGGIGGIIQFLSRSLSLAKRNSYVHGFQAAFIGHQVPHCVGAMPLGKGQRLQLNAAFFRQPQQPIATMTLGYNLLDGLVACPLNGRLAGIKGFEVLFEGFHGFRV